MTPLELKSSILQLAIQGKLVEQRPEEGTAEELYQQIQEEKRRLIKYGKIKKEISLPEVTEDELFFDIPDGWKWCRIADVLCLIRGITFPGSAKSKTPLSGCIQCATTGSVQLEYNEDADVYVPIEYVKNDSQWLQHEDIMISSANSKELVGKSCQWTGKNKTSFGGFLTIARPFDRNQSKYLFYYLRFLHWSGYFARVSTQTTNIANINNSILSKTLVPLPPLAEQERIVAKIEELLPYIDRYEQAWSKLEDFNKRFPVDMQKSILQMAIQGKLVEQRPEEGTGEELYHQIQTEKQKLIKEGKIKKEKPLPEIAEDEVPFEIPDSWKWVRFAEVIDVRDGTHDTPKYVPEGIPLVTSKNLVAGDIDFRTTKQISIADAEVINSRSAVDDRDILFAMIGTIGNPVLVKKDREFCVKNMALFKAISQDLLDMNYLLLFLQNEQYAMKKKASGGVQAFVSLKFLRNYLLPLPPYAEQKRIVAQLEELLPMCEKLK